MAYRGCLVLWLASLATHVCCADELLYRYEGDVLPFDESAGWLEGRCEGPCSVAIERGHFIMLFREHGGLGGYGFVIAGSEDPPPSSLWVEWRFRSNTPMPPTDPTCDAGFTVDYRDVHERIYMFADAVVSFSWDDYVLGLNVNDFHTLRFESPDGVSYRFSVDGLIFTQGIDHEGAPGHYLSLDGSGLCDLDVDPKVNEWDFVRFGTISRGEQVVSADPPAGLLDARRHGDLDRFTVTFDSPNYPYVDEISVQTSGGDTPIVVQTRRREDDGPETVQIVLDRPIPMGETTRFNFDDGVAVNVIEYTFTPADTDGDGDVDLFDTGVFQGCFGGEALSGVCRACDFTDDGWIGLSDYAVFSGNLAGPGGAGQRAERTSSGDNSHGVDHTTKQIGLDRYALAASTASTSAACQLGKLTASDAAPADYFGGSVGVSGDWAVVGAWQDDDAGSTSGSAYVFRRDGNGTTHDPSDDIWIEHVKLTASDGAPYAQFGYSVAADGDCIVVGAWKDASPASGAGSAYVFRRGDAGTPTIVSDDVWYEEAKLVPDDPPSASWRDNFGRSVAVSDEYVVVGVPYRDTCCGAAYVFRREGASWLQEAVLHASDRMHFDFFGFSVSISGGHILVGAHGNDDGGSEVGSAYVFRREDGGTPSDPDDDTWVEQAKLAASDGAELDRFGWSVGIDEDRAVVGAPQAFGGGPGAAYVFQQDDNATPDDPSDDTWVEQAKLTASNAGVADRFGYSVATEGDYIVVGANLGDGPQLTDSGAAYVFHRDGDDWVDVAQLSAADAAFGDGFGRSVSISGGQILVGSWADDDAGLASGSAYFFSLDTDCTRRPARR